MSFDQSFWALVALVIFFALVIWLKAPKRMAESLDTRAEKIREELEEARRLREEAQELLAEYQRKRKEAEAEAEAIIAAGKHEAELLAQESASKTAEFLERRTALAEQKIAQAESQAVADVRALAVNIAIAASEAIIRDKVSGNLSDDLIARSIAEVKAKLN
jgi:F-type H+-transporting ATPase subunit b